MRDAIVGLATEKQDLDLLDETIDHLDDIFLLCVVGEFNAGA